MFTFPVDLVKDLIGWFGPDERVFALVPAGDEGADLDHQVADRGEAATADRLAFDDAKPDLDQVQPRPGRRGEVNLDPRVRRQPGADLDALVRGVVVHHEMQLDVGVGPGYVLEEGEELLVTVPLLAQSGNRPGRDLQRREQRGGAV